MQDSVTIIVHPSDYTGVSFQLLGGPESNHPERFIKFQIASVEFLIRKNHRRLLPLIAAQALSALNELEAAEKRGDVG